MSNIERVEISQLVLVVAGQLLETLVRRHVSVALKVDRRNANSCVLEDGAPALFARAQRRFEPHARSVAREKSQSC
jgi:hypothetical protein